MSMLRQDPLTGRWVIFAAGRSERPNEFPAQNRGDMDATRCPFCPGQEQQTTPEIVASGRPEGKSANSPGWRMRVFPNKYPALAVQNPKAPFGLEDAQNLFPYRIGVGHHEVVVYTPDHMGSPATLTVDQLTELLVVLRDRSRVFARHPDVRYVSPFCNHGPEAGATLAHPHMQIIGAPAVPLLAAKKNRHLAEYHQEQGRCLVCDLAKAERASGARIIAATDDWTAFTPWASRFPWEMLFVPQRHGASLMQAQEGELVGLAAVLAPALDALFRIHGDPSLNIVLHSANVSASGQDENPDFYHWHLEVLPRLSRPAGFEVGTGYTINSVVPEDAARWLRQEGK